MGKENKQKYIIIQILGTVKKAVLDQHNKIAKECRTFVTEDLAVSYIRHQCTYGEYNIIPIGKYEPKCIIIKSKCDLTYNDKKELLDKYEKESL